MASSSSPVLILGFALWIMLISPARSQTCKSQKLTGNKVFPNCSDLPVLKSVLHWSYDASNSSLSVAFTAPPAKPDGWIAWAINPIGTGMPGAQAIVAARNSNGSISVQTYNISSYSSIVPSKLSFEVWDLSTHYAAGQITIFATVKVPEKATKLNQVWQVGPGVNHTTGFLEKHDFGTANLNAKGTLDLDAGISSKSTAPASSPAPAPAPTNASSSNSTGNSTDTSGKNGGNSVIASSNSLGLCIVSLMVIVSFLAF